MAVEKLSANENAVLKAIKSGSLTVEDIATKTKLAPNVVILVTGLLSRKNEIRKNPNTKEFVVLDPKETKEKITCYGNLLLPTRFMTNQDTGVRYAVRGTWNEVAADTTEDDIIWVDNTEETGSKKSTKEPKDRSHMTNPVTRVVLPSRFQQWSNKAIVKNTIKGNYTATSKDYTFDLIVGDSRDGLTHVEGGVRIKIGKTDLMEYPVLKKCLLVDTKKLTDYLKGLGSLFTLEDFLAKPESRTVYFPLTTKNSKLGSTGTLLEFTRTMDDVNALTWRSQEFIRNTKGEFESVKRLSSDSGSLKDVEKILKEFSSALKSFKVSKAK